jgi:hypothetical protein
VAPEAYLKLKRPDFLIVRTDNAAALLLALQRDDWFARTYDLVATRRDAHADREFRTYRKKGGGRWVVGG